MKFSERHGHKPARNALQLDEMDDDLTNSIWNAVHYFVLEPLLLAEYPCEETEKFKTHLWMFFWKLPLSGIPYQNRSVCERIQKWFYEKAEWFEVYDFLEFTIPFAIDNHYEQFCNSVLIRESSGYRIVNGLVTPLTNDSEIKSIETAANHEGAIAVASHHIQIALKCFSDRKKPDYANSIKESIHAVEAICRVIAESPDDELGPALKKAAEKLQIHGALQKGFASIYGWTSDDGGIRHSRKQGDTPADDDDARYMLVSCSAFVNYLVGKCQKAGIKLS